MLLLASDPSSSPQLHPHGKHGIGSLQRQTATCPATPARCLGEGGSRLQPLTALPSLGLQLAPLPLG